MNALRVLIDIPDAFLPRARYALEFLSAAWGLRVDITHDPNNKAPADLVYSAQNTELLTQGHVVIPFDEKLYNGSTICSAIRLDGRQVWTRQGVEPESIDLIASTFRLLTLADEQQIASSARDNLGNFLVKALPIGRRAALDISLADHHAALLLKKLMMATPNLRESIVPRWPNRKTYAICLTHDADIMNMGHPRELAANLAKWPLRHQRVYLDMALEGLRHFRAPMESACWGFWGWRDYEKARGLRSCFYLPVPSFRGRRRFHDCKSDAMMEGIDWKVLQEMQAQGWEFGLHPALNAQMEQEEIVLGKRALEDRLRAPITGLRHHYLAIDNLAPHLTFRGHVAAGFAYDSSLGWHEEAGFRAGTSLPFRPYDPEREKPLALIELPMAIMDIHVMKDGVVDAVAVGRALAEKVRALCGLLVLNWHMETYFDGLLYKGYRNVLAEILSPLIGDSSAWLATPSQIVEWWSSRYAEMGIGHTA